MSDEHAQLSHWVAAYALGALDAADRRAFERHRASCSICNSELASLAPISALISPIDPDELERTAHWPLLPSIEAAANRQYQNLERSRRGWRAGAAVAALGLAALSFGLLKAQTHDQARPIVAAQVLESRIETASVTTGERVWGTEVSLQLAGLPPRTSYQLWAIHGGGQWTSVATWGPTPSGATRLTGATSIATGQLEHLLVTSDDPDEILVKAAVSTGSG